MKFLRTAVQCLAIAIVLAPMVAIGRADDPKGQPKAENKLIGTWKLVSAKNNGAESKLPEGFTQLKHVTPNHFMWAVYDANGKVLDALGGSYTLKGDQYVETPEYGIGSVLDQLKGKPQVFTWKLDGNKWQHNGKLSIGVDLEEVWERVEKN